MNLGVTYPLLSDAVPPDAPLPDPTYEKPVVRLPIDYLLDLFEKFVFKMRRYAVAVGEELATEAVIRVLREMIRKNPKRLTNNDYRRLLEATIRFCESFRAMPLRPFHTVRQSMNLLDDFYFEILWRVYLAYESFNPEMEKRRSEFERDNERVYDCKEDQQKRLEVGKTLNNNKYRHCWEIAIERLRVLVDVANSS